ncbi:SPOSA6832_03792, partial [Sporobolomyces salmonicolor]
MAPLMVSSTSVWSCVRSTEADSTQIRCRHHRSLQARAQAPSRPSCRLLPRLVPRSFPRASRLPRRSLRLPRSPTGRHLHLVRYSQVFVALTLPSPALARLTSLFSSRRFRRKGHFGHHVPLEGHPEVPVLGHYDLAGRRLCESFDGGFSVRLCFLPGALLAAAWASLLYLGIDGYTDSCREIVGAAKRIVHGIRKDFPELYVLGDPLVSVVAFGSRSEGKGNGVGFVPVYEVGDRMGKLGQRPAEPRGDSHRLHPTHRPCRRRLPARPPHRRQRDGLGSSSAVGPGLVEEMASRYMDVLYA